MKVDTFTRRFASTIAAVPLPCEDGRQIRLLEWLEEFDGPCSEARGHVLAARLGTALESYMGIDRGILTAAFLAEYLEKGAAKQYVASITNAAIERAPDIKCDRHRRRDWWPVRRPPGRTTVCSLHHSEGKRSPVDSKNREFPELIALEGSDPPAASGTMNVRIWRTGVDASEQRQDRVAVEAPLEYMLHHPALGIEPVSFGTTMRTPGDDEYLAAGLLFGEGLVNTGSDIEAIESSTRRPNVVNVRLNPSVQMEMQLATRRFSAGSSCGVCGTTGLDAAIARAAATRVVDTRPIDVDLLLRLPDVMRAEQSRFGDTGGIHGAALFDFSGKLITLAEDVGRHNAVDKLVGENLLAGRLPLSEHILLLSGRASFELVQKALRTGVAVVAAIGAPSSLAVNLALASNLTLVGFLRLKHFNVYSCPERLHGMRASVGDE